MSPEQSGLPYWRLSAYYFFNCAVLGAILPYWALYMNSEGFEAQQIALITSVLMASNIVAPYFWGWLTDTTGKRLSIVRSALLLACISFAGIFLDNSFPSMALFIALCGFCWQGINAQFEIITLNNLKKRTERYSQIRLWGSVGFVSSVSGLGVLFEYMPLSNLPVVVLILLCLMWACSLLIQDEQAAERELISKSGLQTILKKPQVWGLVLAVTMAYFSHGAYYSLFSLYLVERGVDSATIGLLWTIAVIAELAVFLFMQPLLRLFGLRNLFLASLFLTAVRWVGTGLFVDSLLILMCCQLLHGLSFSVVHAVTIELIRQRFGALHQGKGQAIYAAVCVGIGQASGAAFSGWIWHWSASGTFLISAAVAVVAFLVALKWQVTTAVSVTGRP